MLIYRHLMRCFRFVSLSCLLFSGHLLAEQGALEDIKAVYLYNFLSFIQWPESAMGYTSFEMCVQADEMFVETLQKVVASEQVDGKSVKVLSPDEAQHCHLLYLRGEQSAGQAVRPYTLLVGDAPEFVAAGGMVGFETRGRKVRVAMNLTELEKAGLRVSSKLLRVVRIER